MAVSIRKARDYVFGSGLLWEQALFAYLFEDGPIDYLHQCLLCYKNADGGWGHGLEHDLKCPDSNPLALEYLLSVIRDTGIPIGSLLAGTVAWLENNRNDDGSLKNPDSLRDYPLKPWWNEWGGQKMPDSIVGNLTKLGLATPSLAESTRRWVQANLTLEKIRANEWLFMAYHAHDYFMNVVDFPNGAEYRQATLENMAQCAERAPEKQYLVLFQFATKPDSPTAKAMPPHIIERNLDYLLSAQREDGGWDDEHGLTYWQPYISILALLALKNYGKLA